MVSFIVMYYMYYYKPGNTISEDILLLQCLFLSIVFHDNLRNSDSDGDGAKDGEEIAIGFNPLNPDDGNSDPPVSPPP